MGEEFELIAKTLEGLEEVLAQELTELGANDVEIGKRMVAFKGDKRMMYKANFGLRTAIRILKPICHFTANTADEVYEQVKMVEWERYISPEQTFAVDEVIFSNEFRHSKFVAYRVKDAIADYFMEKVGKRPGVRVTGPDLLINIHIAETSCTLSLDSSGESLHRRGYRQETLEAPLNEVLAAGIILMTGWRGECDFIDPMCGSGTLPIEAALIARRIAPGVFRKQYAFEKWTDFDADLFEEIYNDDSNEQEFAHHIYGYDNNPRAIKVATRNVKAAGLSKIISLNVRPFQAFEKPEEQAIIVTNPPYGERISSPDLLGLYRMIGEKLKHAFTGNTAWILSYRDECFDQIGLKPTRKIALKNGALECQLRQYELFEGKYKQFREEGERLDKQTAESPSKEEKRAFNRERRPFGEGKREFRGERRNFGEGKGNFGEGRGAAAEEKRTYSEGKRSFGDGKRPFGMGKRSFSGEKRSFGEEKQTFKGEKRSFKGKDFQSETRKPRSGESYPERKRREAREKGDNK